MTTRYAIVPSRGRYFDSQTVSPLRVCRDLGEARKLAAKYTQEYQHTMRSVGGSSGGYRVVATSARNRDGVSWLGHELDREQDA